MIDWIERGQRAETRLRHFKATLAKLLHDDAYGKKPEEVKVWMVESGVDFEDCGNIVGVFATEELARAAVDHFMEVQHPGKWYQVTRDQGHEWEGPRGLRVSLTQIPVESRPRDEWPRSVRRLFPG